MPEGGYSKIVRSLFDLCKADVKLGEKVIKIDYTNDWTEVVTDKATYKCKHVVGSIPLGVLQAKKIEFVPSLPETYQNNL